MLDVFAHPSFCNTTSTKYLNGIASRVLCRSCAIALQERNLTANKQLISRASEGRLDDHVPSKLVSLDLVTHMIHLVSDVLEPSLQALHACDHRRQFAPNDSELMQWFAPKGSTLRDPPSGD
jgi:hypothetical protein